VARVIIVYESKYGNTRQVAETIGEGIQEDQKDEVIIQELGDVDLNKIGEYDVILIGSPNHMGGPTRSIKKFIEKLGKLDLKEKRAAVFDTYIGRDYEKAVKRMEAEINKKAPGLYLIENGLSIAVKGMKGPIVEGELDKCREFGIKIQTQFL
jgi:flavodoxin